MLNWKTYIHEHPQAGPIYQRVNAHPSWVLKGALLAGVVVVGVPLVLLSLAAVVVGLGVFIILGLVARILALFTGDARGRPPHASNRSADDGRRNVRVIQR